MKEIEVRVADLNRLFDAVDPSPLRSRDLDPRVEAFIVDWAKDLPRNVQIGLVVHVDHVPEETALVGEAVREHFRQRAGVERRRLHELFARGRISLAIGLAFLGGTLIASKLVENWLAPGDMRDVVRVSLSIAGWVAMWRPLEVFLYDWWPIRAEARLSDRLASMPVRVTA